MTKIVIIGNSGVGKTCIVNAFVNDVFYDTYQPTVGASYLVKEIEYDGNKYKLNIWDTAGQEKYQSMTPIYFHNAKICLLVFSLTDQDSYDSIDKWSEIVTSYPDSDIKIILLGNKYDLENERVVTLEQCISKAQSLNVKYIEVSAKTRYGIDELTNELGEIVSNMAHEEIKKEVTPVNLNDNNQKTNKKGCCK